MIAWSVIAERSHTVVLGCPTEVPPGTNICYRKLDCWWPCVTYRTWTWSRCECPKGASWQSEDDCQPPHWRYCCRGRGVVWELGALIGSSLLHLSFHDSNWRTYGCIKVLWKSSCNQHLHAPEADSQIFDGL